MAELRLYEAHHSYIRRHICTKEDPWNISKGKYAIHSDAKVISERAQGSIKMQCPNCSIVFQEIAVKKE